jgi:hypothetical protein
VFSFSAAPSAPARSPYLVSQQGVSASEKIAAGGEIFRRIRQLLQTAARTPRENTP